MISIKRNSLLKAFEAYQKETKDEVKKDNLSKKYEDDKGIFGNRNSFSFTDHDATFMRMK